MEVKMKSRIILAAICTFFLFTSISFGYKATFTPRISVKGQYDDNIFLTQNENLKEDDFITTISPGFTAEILGKNNGANISYDASCAMYDKWDEFDGWRHRANFSGWSQLTKNTGLKIRDKFLYTEDPIRDDNIAEIRTEDPEIPIDSTTIKTRRIYYQNLAGVGLNHQFGKYNSSFKIGYKYWFREEDDPAYEDKKIHTPSAGVTYWFSPQWGFDVNGNYEHVEYEFSDDVDLFSGSVSFLKRFGKHFTGFVRYSQRVANYEGETEDDITYIPSIGFKYDIEKDITLIADVGYFYNDYEIRESESGVSGDIRLIKKFERGKLNFAALGGSDYSLYDSDNLGFSVFYEASVSGTYQFAKHLGGNIFGSYRNTDYIDADRKDKRPTVGCGLSWKALEWMNLGLDYRFRKVDSTRDVNDYDDNRVSVTITLIPTVPFHTSRY